MNTFLYQKLPIILGLCATLCFLKIDVFPPQKNLNELDFFTKELLLTQIAYKKEFLTKVPNIFHITLRENPTSNPLLREWLAQYEIQMKIEPEELKLNSLLTLSQNITQLEADGNELLRVLTDIDPYQSMYQSQKTTLNHNPDRSTISLGETFKTKIFLTENFSPHGNGEWYINGQRAELQSNGYLFYQNKPTSRGEKKLDLSLIVTNPITNEDNKYSKEITLTVE